MTRWFRWRLSVADTFVCRCLTSAAMLRFHLPLIKPDMRISRIRLSDKESRGRTREVARSPLEFNESQGVVHITRGKACGSPSRHLVFPAQPLLEPVSNVAIHDPIPRLDEPSEK